jgi:hypothetical protein
VETIVIEGLSAGTATVILCASRIAQPIRDIPLLKRVGVLECMFCTSFWISLLHNPSKTVLATMAIANISIMLINWSMTTYSNEEDTDETPS